MSTFMFKTAIDQYTPVSNLFIDKYMPKARGEFVKVYLLGFKYCISGELGVNSTMLANTLHLLETDIINAWNYWNEEGVVRLHSIDHFGNYSIEFLELKEDAEEPKENVSLLQELTKTSVKGMLQEIEKLIGRPLSPKEMTMYIGWQKDYNFSPEIILLLIQYAASKGKTDSRYIEKIAIAWHDANIKSIDDAQSFIRKHEDKWVKIRKIMSYLGMKDPDIMKPQEEMLDKWINLYKFPVEVIYKACDICFERINKADFKYIDGILSSWFKEGLTTLEDIAKKDTTKPNYKKNQNFNRPNKGTFNNYEQRTYDFEDLEKKLLGWENTDD